MSLIPGDHAPPPNTLPPPPRPRPSLPASLGLGGGLGAARPCCCLSSQTGRLGLATLGFGTDVCKLTGGWESSDLHPGADRPSPPPPPLTPLPLGAPGQSHPPILPSQEPQAGWGGGQSPQRRPGRREERLEASTGDTLKTPILCNPQLSMAQTKLERNPKRAQSGAAAGPWRPRRVHRARGQDIFREPAWQAFLSPLGRGHPRGWGGTSALSCSQQSDTGHTQGLSRLLQVRGRPELTERAQAAGRQPGLAPSCRGRRELKDVAAFAR